MDTLPTVLKKTYKRDNLIADEQKIQESWNIFCYPDASKPKYFITFPFPYQNGTLHLGHAYTLSKAEFHARFMILKGYNVLFPFGFHGTGMPIVACANKLKESLQKYDLNTIDIDTIPNNDQIKILHQMKIKLEEIPKFIDPYYWLEYFPIKAIEDLKSFGTYVDYSKSFITTDINPYFDSFVQWQFNQLYSKGYLKFGKKPIIFSPKDNQACSDHDRSIGEGIGIKEFNIFNGQLDNSDIDIIFTENMNGIDAENIKFVLVCPGMKLYIFQWNNKKYIAQEYFIQNLKYQINEPINIINEYDSNNLIGQKVKFNNEIIEIKDSKNEINGSGFKIILKDKEKKMSEITGQMKYYEPDGIVISRSGDKCVVSITDQWFIDYGVPELKDKVRKYINSPEFNTFGDEVKNIINKASEWIDCWPCSRSFGLGTKLPMDPRFVIDSLSDSTIYMAYYTISHLVQLIPFDVFKQYADCTWNYVFKGILFDSMTMNISDFDCSNILKMTNLAIRMRKEFLYWYPVNLRVSAKDLAQNHLIMCLYNHCMIWDEIYFPKQYFINGYILLNGEKMSKSKGNFMTLRDAINKYGADATRIALAEAGSSTDDANFNEMNADNAVIKLTNEKDWCKNMIDIIITTTQTNDDTIWDQIFIEEIKQCLIETEKNYINLEYQKAMTSGFHRMLSIRDNYRLMYEKNLIKMSTKSIFAYLENFLLIIYPICPHITQHIWQHAKEKGINFNNNWPSDININCKYLCYRDVFNTTINRIMHDYTKSKKLLDKNSNEKINIQITFNKYTDLEITILKEVFAEYNKNKTWKEITKNILSKVDKKNLGNYGKFLSYVGAQVELYGIEYFDLVLSDMKEYYNLIKQWLPKLIFEENIIINIKFEDGSDKTLAKFGPLYPNCFAVSLRSIR